MKIDVNGVAHDVDPVTGDCDTCANPKERRMCDQCGGRMHAHLDLALQDPETGGYWLMYVCEVCGAEFGPC